MAGRSALRAQRIVTGLGRARFRSPPSWYRSKKHWPRDYPGAVICSVAEYLVCVVSHELFHVWQAELRGELGLDVTPESFSQVTRQAPPAGWEHIGSLAPGLDDWQQVEERDADQFEVSGYCGSSRR
jgi:hypothetical protein